MITMFLLAGLLSLALAGLAVLSLVCGGAIWAFARSPARGLVPYLLLVAPIGSLSAVAGAWGCGAALARSAAETALPIWGWVGGLLVGGVLGGAVGLAAAHSLVRRTSRGSVAVKDGHPEWHW